MRPEGHDLTKLDKQILRYLLSDGANGPSGIAENVDSHPNSVSRRLPKLRERGYVYEKSGGVWSITRIGIRTIREIKREEED